MDTSRLKKSVKVYQKSDVIFEENTCGNEMYILKSGKVRLALGDTKQGADVGCIEQPGEFFGEMALIDNSPRSATAIADEDNTELEVLDRRGLLEMIREQPQFALQLMSELCKRVRVGNTLYLEVIRGAMSPFCRNNCLGKTMDAFARQSMCQASQGSCGEITEPAYWRCPACDYVYLPESGDPKSGVCAETPFEKLPYSWICPECGGGKGGFEKIES